MGFFTSAFFAREKTYTDQQGYTWAHTDYFGFGDLSKSKDSLKLSLPSAEGYFREHGRKYPWQQMWLRHGKNFPSPARKLCVNIQKAKGFMRPGGCYDNALKLALGVAGKLVLPHKEPKTILYCEGFAVHPVGPYPHAWLIIDGNVYDPTWPDGYRANYFGIAFEPKFVLDFAERNNCASLTLQWQHTEPYLARFFNEN